jgi:cytochrome c peroxidase
VRRGALVVAVLAAAGCGRREGARLDPEAAAGHADGTRRPAFDPGRPADADAGEPLPALGPAPPLPPVPVGLPPVALPDYVTAERVALGELLFFDRRIGKGGLGACVDCHRPALAWSDGVARSTTLGGKPNLRHTPALANLAWVPELGWDGRFPSAPDAVRAHWKGQLDVDPAAAVAEIAALPGYRAHFRRAAQGPPTVDAAIEALAAFALTRYQGDAPWDRYERGDRDAASTEAVAGYALFLGRAQCSTCHVPPHYTDHGYHRLGLVRSRDEGRGRVDRAAAGAFRTPTLRGAALHPPYFHDGSAATLEDAVDWHLAGGTGQGAGPGPLAPALTPVVLTAEERGQLLAFLRALSPPAPSEHPAPELP